MATPTGGQFKFSAGGTKVNLGLTKTGASKPKPGTVSGALNIEVFTGVTTGILPTLAKGFTQGVIVSDTVTGDAAPHLVGTFPNEILTGRRLTLFGGNYMVTDSVTGSVDQRPARITAGTGNQTIVGAAHDTLTGGTGTQLLVGTAGKESIRGSRHAYTIEGGVGDTIRASHGAVSVTAGNIDGSAGSMKIVLGKIGSYTVTGGAGDSITAIKGSANATITHANHGRIDLTPDTGRISVLSTGKDIIITGKGLETVMGGPGDRIGVADGSNLGAILKFGHGSTVAGAIEFGSNDTVQSTKYNTKTGVATRDTAIGGTSSANVTVTNFRVGTDSLFYKGETSTLNHDIVVTAHAVTGGTKIILPDGTTMTLLGVTTTQLATQNSLGHLFKVV
jgi:hypothetical protein